jgi:hypothetical protein
LDERIYAIVARRAGCALQVRSPAPLRQIVGFPSLFPRESGGPESQATSFRALDPRFRGGTACLCSKEMSVH